MKTAVCVTPPGRSAIASIRVVGFESLHEFDSLFSPAGKRKLVDCQNGRVVFGEWTNLIGSKEELVVTLVSADKIEVHCHGGSAAVSAVLDSLSAIGFETSRRDRLDWKQKPIDLAGELNCGLLNAPTRKIADYFLSLIHSSAETSSPFDRKLEKISLQCNRSTDEAIQLLKDWKNSYACGQFLTRPVRVILAGPPNVGKSSINNRILGYSRSIIFNQPGTTRDVVSEKTTIDGWHFEFSDTAGLRESDDSIESAGIDLAKRKIDEADLMVWIQDATGFNSEMNAGKTELDFEWLESAPRKQLMVINKTDQIDATQRQRISDHFADALFTSAIDGQGIEELMVAIKDKTVSSEPKPGDAVLFTPRQLGLVDECIFALESHELEKAQSILTEIGASK